MKIILDTNVFISGVFFTGPPYQILNAWRKRKLQIVVSPKILEEYKRVAKDLTTKISSIDIEQIIELLAVHAELIETRDISCKVCDDPDDDKFIECAMASKSKIVVSGDKHLLKISGYQGISVLRPREFVNEYL